MNDDGASRYVCSNCDNEIEEDDDFCRHCGAVFAENILCHKHRRTEAAGVCVVCATPCCDECGGPAAEQSTGRDIFLCNRHIDYEIYQGMVKVYATTDAADAEFVSSRLLDAGLHPELLRLHRPKGRGKFEYEPHVEGDAADFTELKLVVPCPEVGEAEGLMKEPTEKAGGGESPAVT